MVEEKCRTLLDSDEISKALNRYIKNCTLGASRDEKDSKKQKKVILLGGCIDDEKDKIVKAFKKCTMVSRSPVIFLTTERYDADEASWEGDRFGIKNFTLSRILSEFLNAPIISLQDPEWPKKFHYYVNAEAAAPRAPLENLLDFLKEARAFYIDQPSRDDRNRPNPPAKEKNPIWEDPRKNEPSMAQEFLEKDQDGLLYAVLEHLATDKRARRVQKENTRFKGRLWPQLEIKRSYKGSG